MMGATTRCEKKRGAATERGAGMRRAPDAGKNQRVVTGSMSDVVRLFRRLVEMVRSKIEPQLMHFQA